jgi:peptide-methionine (S)-S-oxide reductase
MNGSRRTPHTALSGRDEPVPVAATNRVTGHPMTPPYPDGLERAVFGTGCFWGTEEIFWQVPGVWTTAVGYAGGTTPNPRYEEVCSGATGHAEVVLVVFDPTDVRYEDLLNVFWETHDPTQGMRQGNDVGSQYRSVILTTDDAQLAAADASRTTYQAALTEAGRGAITTEIEPLAGPFFFAEDSHQQYLDKHPNGYRCHAASGVPFPIG